MQIPLGLLILASAILLLLLVAGFKLSSWRRRRRPSARKNYILIDGSNVMYWEDQTPKVDPVRDVIRLLQDKGFTPGVMFDANAGYLLSDGYKHNQFFADMFDLPVDQVMVVGKGVQADSQLLEAARFFDAKVVTNDMFRDWAKQFPEVRTRGHLIHGGYHKGRLWLDFDGSRPRQGRTRRKKR